MQYTKSQQEVIDTRDRDILVSAGAGSGKTAVLVQRIMSRLTDAANPVDVDRILVLTFTRAAAAQMKQRLLDKMRQYLIDNPGDSNMQMQQTLLHQAQITTIDSFCLYILRNHFHEAGVDPDFRISDNGEENLIKQEVLAGVLEECFEKKDEDFLFLTEALNPGAKESRLESSILKLADYASSHPWPSDWLTAELESDFDAQWQSTCKGLFEMVCEKLEGICELTELLEKRCAMPGYPLSYAATFESDRTMLEGVLSAMRERSADADKKCSPYTAAFDCLPTVTWARLASVKKADAENIDEGKKLQLQNIRKSYKESVGKLCALFTDDEKTAKDHEKLARKLSDALIRVVLLFRERLIEKKKEKNVFSFSDIEHFALDILYRDRKPSPTAIAYRDLFEEIMVDEYQDSNQVQEMILSAIARTGQGRRNRFMVGDKKQSIYRFRMARPELFNERFTAYQEPSDEHRLILLRQNFRSRGQVIDSVNRIFSRIMRSEFGGIDYNEKEELLQGGSFPEGEGYETELMLCGSDATGRFKRGAEAAMIVQRINKMVGSFLVRGDDGKPRPLKYRDIAILVRSYKDTAPLIAEALSAVGIPAHCETRTGYYDAPEVRVLMDLLRCIENPYHDIPLVSALRSDLFLLSDTQLAQIRSLDKKCSFYECLKLAAESGGNEEYADNGENGDSGNSGRKDNIIDDILKKRAAQILDVLGELRDLSEIMTVDRLIGEIFSRFRYREVLLAKPYGMQRAANADMLLSKAQDFAKTSYQGLFWFIRYIEKLARFEVQEGEAGILSEQADVVRILTIHASKGLEYPVVFVAACDKSFNESDFKQPVIADIKAGISADWIDVDNRQKGVSVRKKLMVDDLSAEAMGEELRLLYVAATRAEEKLIFTATVKPDDTENPYGFLYGGADEIAGRGTHFSPEIISDIGNYLTALMMVLGADENALSVTYTDVEEIDEKRLFGAAKTGERAELLSALLDADFVAGEVDKKPGAKQLYEKLEERFSFVYPHEDLKDLYAKTSVSELKAAAMDTERAHSLFEEEVVRPYLPMFAKDEAPVGGADRGTAYHRVMELLDFGSFAGCSELGKEKVCALVAEAVSSMVEKERMQEEQAGLVSDAKIAAFLMTDTAARMSLAVGDGSGNGKGTLKKEQPFVITVPANRINKDVPESERVMIQGVIDAFWEEDGELVLLDYKTDYVNEASELVSRYRVQLDLYAEALLQLTGKRVKEKLIYSFGLQRTISL